MKPSVIIALALLMGTLAAFLVSRWIGIGNSNTTGSPVVVAASPIEPGLPLTAIQLKVVRWPASIAPPGSYANTNKLEGRVARQKIYAGEPILDSKLAPIDAKGGLSAMITPGKRAITVRVNDVIAVAGFALPGSFVDILVSAKDGSGSVFSKIVLSRVKVLAIAQETAADPAKPKVVNAVTLELSPQDAEQLDLARSIGSLSLVLRNEMDALASSSGGARLGDLIHSEPVAAAPAAQAAAAPTPKKHTHRSVIKAVPPPPAPEKVEEIRGTQRSEVLL